MKKLLSVIALLSVTFSWVFAMTDLEQYNAANYLATKWFIKSFSTTPKDYRINDNITRKEAMKIIANVAFLKVEDTCEWKFKDVTNDWGCKYIEAALKAGFISQADKFRPDDNITVSEVLKLVFKARNLDRKFNTWDWVKDYVNSAYELKLINGDVEWTSDAKRGFIFVVIAKTFDYLNDKNFILYSDEVNVK